MKKWIVVPLLLTLFTVACAPVEQQAYRSIVAARAFLGVEKKIHVECATDPSTNVCQALVRATAAKDTLIDAVEVYCSSDAFENGGPCDPPKKGTPAADQAAAKLKAATALLDQAIRDAKGVL